ncbi:MAG: hypothetical protein K8W52_11065 [Deltaproteobacteria bacterium]|nr:hypothetical protein [Deltaproteobacteria bacterium]
MSVGLAVIAFASVGGANEVAPGSASGEAGSGERDDYVDSLRQRRDRAPCDRELVLKLVNEQNKQRRHTEALVDVGRFEAACGASFFQLQRATVYALQQLGRSADAVALESAMLVTDPRSSDLWWWRADDRAKAGQPLAALADLRQTFALARSASYSRYAAGLALDIAGAARRPCEAVFALDLFVAVQGGTLVERTERKVRALDAAEGCADRLGRGSAALSQGRSFKVTVGGVPGRFTVERQAGTTVLAVDFARRAGVVAGGEPTDTLLGARLVRGPIGVADLAIEGAVAPDVAVVISSDLPADIDGVLGLSALWLFETQVAEDGTLGLSGTSGH